MIESRKAISARIRGGKHLDANSCNPGNNRPDVNIGADAEGPRGKLDEEGGPRMLVAVASPVKVDGLHNVIQQLSGDRRLQDEVEVGGLILSLAVNRRTRSTGQDRTNLGVCEGLCDTSCDFGQARA